MLFQCKAIVLRTLKFNETSLIVNLYTQNFGKQVYMLKGVRKPNKSGISKGNIFVPGHQLNIVAQHQSNKQFQILKEYTPDFYNTHFIFDIKRQTVALFIIEVLDKCVTEPEANEDLYFFIEHLLLQIQEANDNTLSYLPIYFIIHLSRLLGFQIQNTNTEMDTFLNLSEGIFEPVRLNNLAFADAAVSQLIKILNNAAIPDLQHLQHGAIIKKDALQNAIQFLKIHLPQLGTLKTPDVIQSIFK
jgi:DNA repair protein RecO (recombination protein O)